MECHYFGCNINNQQLYSQLFFFQKLVKRFLVQAVGFANTSFDKIPFIGTFKPSFRNGKGNLDWKGQRIIGYHPLNAKRKKKTCFASLYQNIKGFPAAKLFLFLKRKVQIDGSLMLLEKTKADPIHLSYRFAGQPCYELNILFNLTFFRFYFCRFSGFHLALRFVLVVVFDKMFQSHGHRRKLR